MSTHKDIDRICVVVLLLTLLITILFCNGERLGIAPVIDEDAEAGSAYFTGNDLNGDWDASSATLITLKGDTASVSGGGAYVYNGDVYISSAGRFVVRGTLDDGSLIVSAEKSSKVWILLDGADLRCSDNACLRVDQADKVFLTLAAGSVNTMTGGESYSEAALADGTGGVIFSHDDLTINGSGSLTVTAAYAHAVEVNDELVITGGVLTLTAEGDALHANDSLRICRAELELTAGDDGVMVKNEGGWFYLESGRVRIEAGDDGIHTGGELSMVGGSVSITAGNDGIHADGDLSIADGQLRIAAGDDAVHSDAGIAISGGSLSIPQCHEGIEARTIAISGGDISIYPEDDGLNASGGSSGAFPQQSGAGSVGESWIRISGGSLSVVNENGRDADGLDSNGDLIISGGVIRVSLPGGGTNNALDYGSESGGVCEISGGEIVACGGSAMLEGFSDTSSQCSILYTLSYTAQAGTRVQLLDTRGNVLLDYEVPCSFQSVTLSCPAMQFGESYELVIGEKTETITLDRTVVTAGSGESTGSFGDFGGGQRPGGGRPDMGGGRPDFAGMSPPPDMDGAQPDFSGMGQAPVSGDMSPPVAPGGESAVEEAQQSAVGLSTWLLLGLSVLALGGGLLVAIRFKP